jgi:effector-binding domain-containing protein
VSYVQEAMRVSTQIVAGSRDLVPVTAFVEFFGTALPEVASELAREGVAPVGPPVTVYREKDAEFSEVTAGYPVDRVPVGGVLVWTVLPSGPVVQVVHAGPYDYLGSTYALVGRWFMARDMIPPAIMWEEYLVGPDATDDQRQWRTRLVFPWG